MAQDKTYKIKMYRSLNRQKNFRTPTPSGVQCPHFYRRFIGWGAMNERRAICNMENAAEECSYQHQTTDGTTLCCRYWYGPMYEITGLIDPPLVHKKDTTGNLVYYEEDMVTETIFPTEFPVMIPVSEYSLIPYIENSKVWDPTGGDDGLGAMVPTKPEFFTLQYLDTHEMVYGYNGQLGWHKDV